MFKIMNKLAIALNNFSKLFGKKMRYALSIIAIIFAIVIACMTGIIVTGILFVCSVIFIAFVWIKDYFI